MIIKVLGAERRSLLALDRLTREAVADLGVQATVERITDPGALAHYGIMSIPALVVDEQVVMAGRVPKPAVLRGLLGFLAGRS
jgi:hypothetical protein